MTKWENLAQVYEILEEVKDDLRKSDWFCENCYDDVTLEDLVDELSERVAEEGLDWTERNVRIACKMIIDAYAED